MKRYVLNAVAIVGILASVPAYAATAAKPAADHPTPAACRQAIAHNERILAESAASSENIAKVLAAHGRGETSAQGASDIHLRQREPGGEKAAGHGDVKGSRSRRRPCVADGFVCPAGSI